MWEGTGRVPELLGARFWLQPIFGYKEGPRGRRLLRFETEEGPRGRPRQATTAAPARRMKIGLFLACAMVASPWHLVSPTGRVHYVADEPALRALAVQHGLLKKSSGENMLRRLVDPKNEKVHTASSNVRITHAHTALSLIHI